MNTGLTLLGLGFFAVFIALLGINGWATQNREPAEIAKAKSAEKRLQGYYILGLIGSILLAIGLVSILGPWGSIVIGTVTMVAAGVVLIDRYTKVKIFEMAKPICLSALAVGIIMLLAGLLLASSMP